MARHAWTFSHWFKAWYRPASFGFGDWRIFKAGKGQWLLTHNVAGITDASIGPFDSIKAAKAKADAIDDGTNE